MKRALIVATSVLVLMAVLWFVGPLLLQGEAEYTVDASGLVLRVSRPGLFVDVVQPGGGVPVLGTSRKLFAPWPGNRRRVAALFRGPVDFRLAEGNGPFDLRDLPVPAAGGAPVVRLPDGWRQVGDYAGRFEIVEGGGPVAVAVPAGIASGAAEAAAKVQKLYAAAEKLFGRPPLREKVAVVAGEQPFHLGVAVAELWVPDYAPDARWLETGAAQFYAVKLLDETKTWTSTERNAWSRKGEKTKEYGLTIWLDVSIRLDRSQKRTLYDVLLQADRARTSAEIVKLVNEMFGLGVADHLDRMLKGQEPLPVQG